MCPDYALSFRQWGDHGPHDGAQDRFHGLAIVQQTHLLSTQEPRHVQAFRPQFLQLEADPKMIKAFVEPCAAVGFSWIGKEEVAHVLVKFRVSDLPRHRTAQDIEKFKAQ